MCLKIKIHENANVMKTKKCVYKKYCIDSINSNNNIILTVYLFLHTTQMLATLTKCQSRQAGKEKPDIMLLKSVMSKIISQNHYKMLLWTIITVLMTKCGHRVVEHLTSSFHVSGVCQWVFVNDLPVHSVTLSGHFFPLSTSSYFA